MIERNKFQVGQMARVVKRLADHNNWSGVLDRYVNDGNVYPVERLSCDGGVALTVDNGTDYWYFPQDALELVVPEDEVKVNVTKSYEYKGYTHHSKETLLNQIVWDDAQRQFEREYDVDNIEQSLENQIARLQKALNIWKTL